MGMFISFTIAQTATNAETEIITLFVLCFVSEGAIRIETSLKVKKTVEAAIIPAGVFMVNTA